MSRELVGSNREIVGSAAYFEKLHNTHFSGTLRCSRSEDFARSMESLAENVFVICSSRIWNNLSGNLNEILSKAFEITITSGTKTQMVSELR